MFLDESAQKDEMNKHKHKKDKIASLLFYLVMQTSGSPVK